MLEEPNEAGEMLQSLGVTIETELQVMLFSVDKNLDKDQADITNLVLYEGNIQKD